MNSNIAEYILLSVCSLLIIWYIIQSLKKRDTFNDNDNNSNNTEIMETTTESFMITCPACGTSVSRYASTCIKCGHPIHYRQQATISQKPQQQTIIVQGSKSNGVGTAGFVIAIISLIFSWLPFVGWFVWFLGFILSFIGMFKSPRGLAIVGFLISIIDFIILIALVGSLAAIFAPIIL